MAAKLARENLDGNHSRIQKLVEEWHPEPPVIYTHSDCSRCEDLEDDLADAEHDVRYLRAQVAELKYAQDEWKLAHEGKEEIDDKR